MDKKTGRLRFNYDENRVGILDSMNLWVDSGLHSGQCLEVYLNGEWVSDRIEYQSVTKEWYLVYSELTGSEIEGLDVRY